MYDMNASHSQAILDPLKIYSPNSLTKKLSRAFDSYLQPTVPTQHYPSHSHQQLSQNDLSHQEHQVDFSQLQSHYNQSVQQQIHHPVHDFQNIQQLAGQDPVASHPVDVGQEESMAEDELLVASDDESEIVISDVPVESRARASLPASYLYIEQVHRHHEDDLQLFGVFAKKSIPQRTQFGPVEGVIASGPKSSECPQSNLIVLISDTMILDQSDENKSNWMRFVRTASDFSEQNLELIAKEQTETNPENANELITKTKYYFITTKHITSKEELRVWYSRDYAAKFNLKNLDQLDVISIDAFDSQEAIVTDPLPCEPTIDQLEATAGDLVVASSDQSAAAGGHKIRNKMAKQQQQVVQKEPTPPCSPEVEEEEEVAEAIKSAEVSTETNVTQATSAPSLAQYKCDTCGKSFPRFYSLRRHQVMHSGEKKYKCPVCHMSFSHVYNRNRHVKRHYKMAVNRKAANQQKRSSNDEDAGKENEGNQQVTEPEPKEAEAVVKKVVKPFRCTQCYKTFTNEERLAKHAIVHTSDDKGKPLACPFCEKRFLNNSALSCHLKIHSTPKDQPRRYDCVLCKETFECTQTRKEHIVTHCDPVTGQYPCPNCSKKFDEFSAVRKHVRAFHSDKQYPCSQCEKVFPRPDKLKLHMLRHSDHREFLCQSCGKQFKRKDKLKEHMQRMHAPDREAKLLAKQAAKHAQAQNSSSKKFIPKVSPTDYHRFIYKCHSCLLGFKRRGMLVNHLAKRHPETPPESVPELNLPILKTTRDYYCQYCDKIYKSSSKRKAHILKNHPGKSLPLSNRHKGGLPLVPGVPNPTYSATVGSVTTHPHYCDWCHKQYASKAKLLQHQRKKHTEQAVNCNHSRHKLNGHCDNLVSNDDEVQEDEDHNDTSLMNVHYEHEVASDLTDHRVDHSGHSTNSNSCSASGHTDSLVSDSSASVAGHPSDPLTGQPTGDDSGPLDSVNSSQLTTNNLITILGNIGNLNSIIGNGDSAATADLQELLQANPSVANDLLTQAMTELTQGKAENILIPSQEPLWN
ncbi:PR domain zinc finger protein 10 [Halotydeus destructor]|nr:PR domain zinc finger protein 10 [Halotydeus destructor]